MGINDFLANVRVGCGVLNESKNPIGHEASGAHGSTAARHLGDLNDAASCVDLDPPPVPARDHFIRANLAARIDDDLHPVTAHQSTLPRR